MFPRLTIDLARIRANTERAVSACAARNVDVMGVTKGVCGSVDVARALVDGGVTALGDARLDNLSKLRGDELGVPLWLLRSPSPRDAARCVAVADGSLHSELETLRAVAHEARRHEELHHVVLMVDLDTGREGFHPDDVARASAEVQSRDGLELDGLGVYFDFATDVSDVHDALGTFAELGPPLRVLSGGASNVLELAIDGSLPESINHLRLGTAPLLGLYTSHGPRPIPDWERDTMIVEAEIIEVKRDRAEAILALGHVDAPMDSLYPVTPGVELVRQTSDHTVVRFAERLRVADTLGFRLGYRAMSGLTASRYTRIVYR